MRVVSLLGRTDTALENPKAYLIRAAANLWIDRVRRSARERAAMVLEQAEPASVPPHDALDNRAAARTLFQALHPQERAAILMKDVLDLSLEETAAMLHTTVGAVKSALSRAGAAGGAPAACRLRRAAARHRRSIHARAEREGHAGDEGALRRARVGRARRRGRAAGVRADEDVLRARPHGDAVARFRRAAVVESRGLRR